MSLIDENMAEQAACPVSSKLRIPEIQETVEGATA